jgi:ketosteroid isomerase-like protein
MAFHWTWKSTEVCFIGAALVVSVGNVIWNEFIKESPDVAIERRMRSSEEEIHNLIAAEANAAFEHDVDAAVDLFAPNAVVRDAKGPSWMGEAQIRKRYSELESFDALAHVDIILFMNEGREFASALASTEGQIEGQGLPIRSVLGEVWVFKRIDGDWKIQSFTYNAEESSVTTRLASWAEYLAMLHRHTFD